MTIEREFAPARAPIPVLSERDVVAASREPVAQRIVATLDACAAKKRALTIQEVVHETGLAKTTVHRICWKLVELGLLEHSAGGFSIGSQMFALASTNPNINQLRVTAIPHLVEMQRRTGSMVNLALLSNGRALVLDGLFTHAHPQLPRLIGHALPLHCTATGKAIASRLSPDQQEELLLGRGRLPAATFGTIVHPDVLRRQLRRIADTGIAFADEELIPGVKGVAAAFQLRGGGLAAIGVVDAWNSSTLRQAPPIVAAAAAALERELR